MSVPFAVAAFVCVLLIKEVPLRTTVLREDELAPEATAPVHTFMSRTDALAGIEHEVGVLIRRVRRVIGARAAMVHPDLQRAAYLMLAYVIEDGPQRSSTIAEKFEIDKGAMERQVQHLVGPQVLRAPARSRRRSGEHPRGDGQGPQAL